MSAARTITLELEPEVADAYERAPEEVRRKLDLLLHVWVLRTLGLPARSLEEIMVSASRSAAESGLTPEILQSILDDR